MKSNWFALALPVGAAAASLLVFAAKATAVSAPPATEVAAQPVSEIGFCAVSTTHAPAEVRSTAVSEGAAEAVCPVSGKRGKSSLSLQEVLDKVHAADDEAAAGACPYVHDRAKATSPADKGQATWL